MKPSPLCTSAVHCTEYTVFTNGALCADEIKYCAPSQVKSGMTKSSLVKRFYRHNKEVRVGLFGSVQSYASLAGGTKHCGEEIANSRCSKMSNQ